jgi:hypothetical protein
MTEASVDPKECPYVGLDPFEASHAAYFFGRRQDSKIIADHVWARSVAVLYGASGVGKSSVLNVGLPTGLPKRTGWIIVRLRNWQDPERLEQQAIEALLAVLPRRPRRSVERLQFAPLVAWAVRTTRESLLLILDQFEEYFLYRDRERMRPLELAMGNLLAHGKLPLHVLVALRDDALHQLDQLRAFVPRILDTTVELGALSDSGVMHAIRGPIKRYNEDYRQTGPAVTIEDALVATLVRQLKEADGGAGKGRAASAKERRIELPYLQLTLTKLWWAEGGPAASALREETLMGLGGVQRIVRDHVNTVMSRLSDAEQDLCLALKP